jgi:hypothetical protein
MAQKGICLYEATGNFSCPGAGRGGQPAAARRETFYSDEGGSMDKGSMADIMNSFSYPTAFKKLKDAMPFGQAQSSKEGFCGCGIGANM